MFTPFAFFVHHTTPKKIGTTAPSTRRAEVLGRSNLNAKPLTPPAPLNQPHSIKLFAPGRTTPPLTMRELARGDSRPVKKSEGMASALPNEAPPFAPAAELAEPPAALPPPSLAAAPLAAAASSCLHRVT